MKFFDMLSDPARRECHARASDRAYLKGGDFENGQYLNFRGNPMSLQVRYFRSQNYIVGEEMSEEQALGKGTYIRAWFTGRAPERAEIVIEGQLRDVIYYGRDPKDSDLVRQHRQEYGAVQMIIYGHPLLTPEGEVQTLSEWNAAGELIQTTKRLVNGSGEPLREEIVDTDGAPRGIRRFEYEGTELVGIVFERTDGARIIELKD